LISNINQLLLKSPQITIKNLDVYLSYAQIIYAYADKEDNEFYNHYAFELTKALIKLLNASKTQHPINILYISQFLNLSISSGFLNANLENIFTKIDAFLKAELQKDTTDKMLLRQGLFYIVSRYQNTGHKTESGNDWINYYRTGLNKLKDAPQDIEKTDLFKLEDFLPSEDIIMNCKHFNTFLANKEAMARLKTELSGRLKKNNRNDLEKLLLTAYSEVSNQTDRYAPQLLFYFNLIK
jgi:hypothetical protein